MKNDIYIPIKYDENNQPYHDWSNFLEDCSKNGSEYVNLHITPIKPTEFINISITINKTRSWIKKAKGV